MELKEILIGLEGLKCKGSLEKEVSLLTSDSREVKEGAMFVAIKGFDTNGHSYIASAIEKGAKVIMVEDINPLKEIALPEDVIETVEVPEIRNMTLKEAEGKLKEIGLQIEYETKEGEEIDKTQIIVEEQTPKPGIKVNMNSKISVEFWGKIK